MTLTYDQIKRAFEEQPLFEDKTWQISPEPWPLSPEQVKSLEAIGEACLAFHEALERLYARSREGKNLLRNRELKAPWVAEYLDRGKPEHLLRHQGQESEKGRVPLVLRPDLLLTDEGFTLTELDAVPGGIGLTAFLNRLYGESGDILGKDDCMVDGFYEALASLVPTKRLPLIAIAVSEEAATYQPEMQWLADTYQRQGKRVVCVHPSDLFPLDNTLCLNIDGNPEEVDVLYRFWELFDYKNVPLMEHLLVSEPPVVVTPPLRSFQEEKLSLGLFHHHLLEDYWRENLPKAAFRILRRAIPPTWIVDPVDLPPPAVLDGPTIGGKPIRNWVDLAQGSQKERSLILKISGFHETAWGARSVTLGNDVSREEFRAALEEATAFTEQGFYILQEFRKPKRMTHPVFTAEGELRPHEGRLRLSPFYFVRENEADLCGALATFCPPDKKIIHGMRDAAMLPCQVVAVEE